MNRCPVCQHCYADSMSYCRLDGTALVRTVPSFEEQETLTRLPAKSSDVIPTEIFGGGPDSKNPITSPLLTMPLTRKRRSSKSKVIDSIAVLPLTNAGDDQKLEYLSDGITESIINSLSQLPKLRVVPRSTVFRYKGSGLNPQEAGAALGVRAVLAGRLFIHDTSLIITTELIDVAAQSQLWGEQYRRDLNDIFALQEEISNEISAKLRLRLSGEEKRKLGKRYTQNTDAYHAYLKGRYYTNKRTTEWIKKGIDEFHRAIDLDPTYALAYAGLADAFAFLSSSTGERPPAEFYPKTQAAAKKALELDDNLAEAHSSLGFYNMMYEWDFEQAKREFERALELNPNYATAHDGYSFYFKATGQHEKAISECLRAEKDDPLSLFAHVSTAWAYYFARQYENAVRQNERALEMDSRFVFAYWNMGLALAMLGRNDEAVSALENAVKHSGGGLTFKAHLAYVYALAKRQSDARRILTDLEAVARDKYVPAYCFAIINLGLGNLDQVYEWLERAREERSGFIAFISVEPMFDKIRSDTRFIDFTRRISPGRG